MLKFSYNTLVSTLCRKILIQWATVKFRFTLRSRLRADTALTRMGRPCKNHPTRNKFFLLYVGIVRQTDPISLDMIAIFSSENRAVPPKRSARKGGGRPRVSASRYPRKPRCSITYNSCGTGWVCDASRRSDCTRRSIRLACPGGGSIGSVRRSDGLIRTDCRSFSLYSPGRS
jgi:hypothetical protein